MPKKRPHRRHQSRVVVAHRTRPGSLPGDFAIDPGAPCPTLHVFGYGPDGMKEETLVQVDALRSELAKWPVVWVNVTGLGDAATLREVARTFGIHDLALEDVVHVHQRIKAEEYAGLYYVALRVAEGDDRTSEQISLFFGKGFVLTFQETPGDCFDPIRERIRRGWGRIRESGADYLAYAILDAVIDSYFPRLERHGLALEHLEERVLARPNEEQLSALLDLRHELLAIRRAVWPLREVIAFFQREENTLISPQTRLYLRDCHDHAARIIEAVEVYRELGQTIMDVYLSRSSHRMSEIMKVLTIIATIFIPLSFVAGVYGMNFDTEVSPFNMPELRWKYGYVAVLLGMLSIALGLLGYFFRRGWLGDDRNGRLGSLRSSDGSDGDERSAS